MLSREGEELSYGTNLKTCTAFPGRNGVGRPSSQALWPSP